MIDDQTSLDIHNICGYNNSRVFEWDEAKREANLAKHGLDFTHAKHVFNDEKAIEIVDNRKNYGEVRKRIIGEYINNVIVAIIHTYRNGATRIISMRLANKKERRLYYGYSQNDF